MLLLLALLFPAVSATSLAVEVIIECNTCVLFAEKCYNVTYLFDIEAPFRNRVVIHNMGIIRASNFLFFSFEPSIEDAEYYKVGFVDLDNPGQVGVIGAGQKFNFNFGTFDIDQSNGYVYLGGSDGIYALDTRANKLMHYSSFGDTITNIFFKNKLYFTRYNDRGIVVKRGDYFKTIFEYIPVKNFVVTKYDFIVFLSKYGLYVGKADKLQLVSNNAFYRGITIDLEDNVYAWWVDGIYKVIIENNIVDSRVEKVAHLSGIGAMTFDNKNNILITSDRALYQMTETHYNCTIR
ncbi:hypothetical protein K1T71_011928 [Dendrolimus kikuchii]|uniref:Uncharacterized protein n=1 Tax=Dendrolimus kikuchii TaxID=765133 RepID=A0ACC1CME5_9NEOP|nr:hypothetical protein K1T71_011928 [Dendrolimus kikuchii]